MRSPTASLELNSIRVNQMSDHLDALKQIRKNQLSLIEPTTNLKKCPYCAEEIQYEAIKCKFCNETLLNHSIDKLGYIHLVQIENIVELKIVIPNWYKLFGKTKFFINNNEITPKKLSGIGNTKKRLLFEINAEKSIYIKDRTWGDPLPEVFVNNEKVKELGNLNIFQKIVAYTPIILVIRGGLIGALCGIPAITLNCKILRLNTSAGLKTILIFLSYCLLGISYVVFAFGFLTLIYVIFGYQGSN